VKTIQVSDGLYEEIKDRLPISSLGQFIGKKLFIRTVTYHLIGEVVAFTDGFFQLENASVVFDSGNFATALGKGQLSQSEIVGKVWVNTASITDMFPWTHELKK
jgi:hypothetical protein